MASNEISSIGVVPGLVEGYAADGFLEEGDDGLTLNEYDPVFPSFGEYLTDILMLWIEVSGTSGKPIFKSSAMAQRTNHISPIKSVDAISETLTEACKGTGDRQPLVMEPLSLAEFV
jgi:hypothetical protein